MTIPGPLIVQTERLKDERGFFARTFAEEEFSAAGVDFQPVQSSVSFNTRRFTLRGLHYQEAPHAEAKLVRCTRGSVFDVMVDIRADSETYGQSTSIQLNATDLQAVFIPEGFAHGFLTLEEGCEMYYMISTPYEPSAERGIRWNDPALNIKWPDRPAVLSKRDSDYPDFAW